MSTFLPPLVWLAGAGLTYWVAHKRSGGLPPDDVVPAAVTCLVFWFVLLPAMGAVVFYGWIKRRFWK